MTTITEAFSIATPWYNLILIITAIYLFTVLFRIKNKRLDLKPWKAVFAAILIALIEEVITVLRANGLVEIPVHINGFFEIVIISLLLYTLLLQRKTLS